MAFIFTCGTHTFNSLLEGHENLTVQCQNCGNFSGKVTKQWHVFCSVEWFTFCFIPIIPFSRKPYHDVSCHICHFNQDIKYRPDVEAQMQGSTGTSIPMQNQGSGTQVSSKEPPQQYQQGAQAAYS